MLTTLDGRVLLSNSIFTNDGRIPAVDPATSVQSSPLYEAALTAAALNEDSRTILYRGDEGRLVLESVHIFYDEEEALGFLMGTFDYEVSVIPLLRDDDAFVETTSYLVTADGDIVAPENIFAHAEESMAFTPLEPAFLGIPGADRYILGEQDTIGYIAPVSGISNIHLALVTETPIVPIENIGELSDRLIVFLLLGAAIAAGLTFIASQEIMTPLKKLELNMRSLTDGDFDAPVTAAGRGDEIGAVGRSFANMRDQIQTLVADMETRLIISARDIQATQEVSRFAATQHDVQILMDQVVRRVTDLFPNIYHTQIFLLDEDRRYAILRASTGDAGAKLLERGHRLSVGGISIIGQVTAEGRIVIARDTAESDVHRKNEFLTDTHAELAIPLRIGETIIGAFDVQSKERDTFMDDQVKTLQTLADQIAIAIENARLYQESVQQLEALAATQQERTLRSWVEHLNYRRQREIVAEAGASTPSDLSPLRQQAITQQEPVVGATTDRGTIPVAVPIRLRGQVLGAVEWELSADDFSYNKIQLAEELVNRLALSLDNARLFQESRRAIERERLVNEIASKLTGQTDIDEILQTAVREVGQALRAPQVNIQLKQFEPQLDSNDSDNEGTSPNGHQA
jgi:GAF domain-containing protein/HAMP domain-containing protein